MSKILTEQEFYTSYVGNSSLYVPMQDDRKKQAKVDNFKEKLSEYSYISYFNGTQLDTIEDSDTLSKLITDNDEMLGYLQINRNRNVNNSFFLASPAFNIKYGGTVGFDISYTLFMPDVTVYSNNELINSTCNFPISKSTNVLTYDINEGNINTVKLKLDNRLQYSLYGFNNNIIKLDDDNDRYIRIQVDFTESATTSVYAEGQRAYNIILYDGNYSTSQPITATENIEVNLYITYSEETKSLWKYMSNDQNIYDYNVKINLYTGESSKTLKESQRIYKNEEGDEEYIEPMDRPLDIINPGPIPSGISMSVTKTSNIEYNRYTGLNKLLDTKAYELMKITPKVYNQTIEL